MYQVYGDRFSGNCYKVKMILAHSGQDYLWHDVDILAGDTAVESFLAINPNAKVPVLKLPNGKSLWESNAILFYLAQGTEYWPADSWLQSQALQWMFFEQYSHEPYIAVARFIRKYEGLPESRRAEFESKQAGGRKALEVMEKHLLQHDFFVGNRYTIADMSLYAYTHVAHEGGFDLAEYAAVQRWLRRVESQPGFAKMG